MSGARVAAAVLAATLWPSLGACGDSEAAMRAEEVLGVWFQCADEACESLADDGFELTEDGTFTTLRREAGDVEGVDYCEVPFGEYARDGDGLELIPTPGQDEKDEPRSVTFAVDGDRGRLTDEAGQISHYLRVEGESSGNCPGVL